MRRPVQNPPNRFEAFQLERFEPAPEVALEVQTVQARSILSRNESPDLPFRYSLNPYQGCYHGCAYCYARPSHQYLGLGAGTDFERRLRVKVNAPQLLRAAFAKPSWQGEPVVFSGNTDCYQPLEAEHGLTRACLEVCRQYANPVSIITKGSVLGRDVELLAALARRASVSVFITAPFVDEHAQRVLEPFAAPLSRRFELMRRLSDAGVETGIAIAPVIVGLNDADVLPLLARAHAAGARHAFMTPLRLAAEVQQVFFAALRAGYAEERVRKVERALTCARGGNINEGRFRKRMQGEGQRWQMVQRTFDLQCQRLGFNQRRVGELETPRTPRSAGRRQLSLFE